MTIFFNTYNRPDYIDRLLRYYYNQKLDCAIIIGDASNKKNIKKNKKIIESYTDFLHIEHLIFGDKIDNSEVEYHCLKDISTKYSLCTAEDDFIVPGNLKICIDFLESNPSYIAAIGKQLAFTTGSNGPYSSRIKTYHLNMVDHSIFGSTAADRIKTRMSQKTEFSAPKLVYAVMKTSISLRIHEKMLSLGLDHSNNEMLLNLLFLLTGNIKLFDKLYIVRQIDSTNDATRAHGRYVPIIMDNKMPYKPILDETSEQKMVLAPDFFDLLTDAHFSEKYERMRYCLVDELVRQDNISIDKAQKIIKYWLWYFMAKNMMSKFFEHGGAEFLPQTIHSGYKLYREKLKKWVKQFSIVKKLWYNYSGGSMSLKKLLSQNSLYYDDFMPIYKAITVRPPDYKDHIDDR